MNTADQLARMSEWLDTHPAPTLPHDPATYEDEQTLIVMHGLSKAARTQQRRPLRLVIDEYGYDQRGTYHADLDGRCA